MYCTSDDIINAFNSTKLAELSADSGTTPDETIIDGVISMQSSIMDSYFVSRYAVPITGKATLALINPHCVRLVLFSLMQSRLLAESYASFLADKENTMVWLQGIASGKFSLPGATLNNTADPSVDTVTAFGGSMTQMFGDGKFI